MWANSIQHWVPRIWTSPIFGKLETITEQGLFQTRSPLLVGVVLPTFPAKAKHMEVLHIGFRVKIQLSQAQNGKGGG